MKVRWHIEIIITITRIIATVATQGTQVCGKWIKGAACTVLNEASVASALVFGGVRRRVCNKQTLKSLKEESVRAYAGPTRSFCWRQNHAAASSAIAIQDVGLRSVFTSKRSILVLEHAKRTMGSTDKAVITGFICRLCSKMNRFVIHIYGEEGERMKLAEKINTYLPITVIFSCEISHVSFCRVFCSLRRICPILRTVAPKRSKTTEVSRGGCNVLMYFCQI